MDPRPLIVLSRDPEVRKACEEAARLAQGAVQSPQFLDSPDGLRIEGREGMVVVDPELFPQGSLHLWALGLLRDSPCLLWLLVRSGELSDADGLARFVGAQGALSCPPDPRALGERFQSPFGAPALRPEPIAADPEALDASLGHILEGREPGERELFVRTITESDSGLYSVPYWEHRLDEEFKRSMRFRFPLSLVSFAFDGEVDDDAISDIAGLILVDTRDVDIVTQFDPRTFLALLPHTGIAGGRYFAQRVVGSLRERGVRDLLGESLEWSWAAETCPNSALPTARDFLARVLRGRSGQLA